MPNFRARQRRRLFKEILDMSKKAAQTTDLLDDQKQHLENLLNDN